MPESFRKEKPMKKRATGTGGTSQWAEELQRDCLYSCRFMGFVGQTRQQVPFDVAGSDVTGGDMAGSNGAGDDGARGDVAGEDE